MDDGSDSDFDLLDDELKPQGDLDSLVCQQNDPSQSHLDQQPEVPNVDNPAVELDFSVLNVSHSQKDEVHVKKINEDLCASALPEVLHEESGLEYTDHNPATNRLLNDLDNFAIYSDSDVESQYSYLEDAQSLPDKCLIDQDFLLLDSDESFSDSESRFGNLDVISLSSEISDLVKEEAEDLGRSDDQMSQNSSADETSENKVTQCNDRGLRDDDRVKSGKKKEQKPRLVHTYVEPHRSPSKKQKKKRSRANRSRGMDLLRIEYNIHPTTEEMSEVCMDTLSEQIRICKGAPSLMDICIKAVKRYHPKLLITGLPGSPKLPQSIRNVFLNYNLQRSMRRFQVAWFSNILLQWEQSKRSLQEFFTNSNPGDPVIGCHNIWNSQPYIEGFTTQSNLYGYRYRYWYTTSTEKKLNENYHGSKYSSYLHWVSWMNVNDGNSGNNYYPYGSSRDRETEIKKRWILTVFGTLMELMMSEVRVKQKGDDSLKRRDEDLLKAVKKNTKNLRKFLSIRFPKMTDLCFDKILPYVYWARGDIKSATEAFSALCSGKQDSTSCSDRCRAMYLSEIGRMHAQVNQTETAKRYYRLAAEVMMSVDKARCEEVRGQMMMMMANLYDQGPMTKERSNNARKMWRAVIATRDSCKDGAYLCAAESLLCFHAGSIQDDHLDWFDFVSEELMSLPKKDQEINYHLSFVYAMLGRKSESDACYGDFLKSMNGDEYTPGMEMVKVLTSRKVKHHSVEALDLTTQNPFEPLLDQVTSGKVKVQPLRVVWRTQLQPLRIIDNKQVFVTNLCSPDLNLRLTPDGYITGDMQMMHPPIRGIYLDTHTGELTFKSIPGETEPWSSLANSEGSLDRDLFSIPTMVEIYRDDTTGTTVHMNKPNMSGAFGLDYYYSPRKRHYVQQIVHLHWTGPNGERAKISVTTIMKNHCYQKVKEVIKKTALPQEKEEEVMALLEECYTKNLNTNLEKLLSAIHNKEKQLQKPKNRSQEKWKMNLPTTHYMYQKEMFNVSVTELPVSFGNCLVLHLNVFGSIFLMFINCSSRNEFVQPKLQEITTKTDMTLKNFSKGRIQGGNVFFNKTGKIIQLYNENGEEIDSFSRQRHAGDRTCFPRAIIGTKVVFINEQKRIWWRDNNEFFNFHDLLEVEEICGVLGDILVLKNEYGLRFADASSTEIKSMLIEVQKDIKQCLKIQISENREQINGKFEHHKIMESLHVVRNGVKYQISAIAIDNYLIIFSVEENSVDRKLTITLAVELPGFATSMCYLDKEGKLGFLCAWTQHTTPHKYYREHICQYDFQGNLLGVLPFLGQGPRSYCPVFLQKNEALHSKFPELGEEGWYLVINDGHEGIMAVRLHDCV